MAKGECVVISYFKWWYRFIKSFWSLLRYYYYHPDELSIPEKYLNIFDQMEIIISEVADKYGIDQKLFSKPSRKKHITKAREIAIKRCRKETEATLVQIGGMFNRNYSTILYILNKPEYVSKKVISLKTARSFRNSDCIHYSDCLNIAAKGNKEFDCRNCSNLKLNCSITNEKVKK